MAKSGGSVALPSPEPDEHTAVMVDAPAGEPYAAVTETHSAVVFLVGDMAYKLKKPVDLGFLDFRTPQARAAACRRETELNQRFAPGVYLGVAEIRDPAGQVCGHLVVMRRMPAALRLSTLVREGAPVEGPLRQVARTLAAQHAAAPQSPHIAAEGRRDAVRARWDASIRQVREDADRLLSPGSIDEVERLAHRFLAGREPLFEQRIRGGRVVDGHGDLLADDIFCLGDGVRILDCLEFDDRLRWLDGLDDAAFLAMDLERLAATALAQRFTGWYAEYSGDPAPPSLHHHYVAYRAFVRAKVACLRAGQQSGEPAAQRAAAQARQLTAMTLRHLRAGAVKLVLIGGLPGTGKTTLAGTLADRLGCTVLSSDRIRKELAGVPPEQRCAARWRTGIYTPNWTERTYGELLRRAGRLLALGESVSIDAACTQPGHRAAAAAVAAAAHADLVQLRCTAPPGVVRERLAARTPGPSDVGIEIAREMAAAHVPWPQAVTIDTSAALGAGKPPGAAALRRALEAVQPHGAEHVWLPTRPVMSPD